MAQIVPSDQSPLAFSPLYQAQNSKKHQITEIKRLKVEPTNIQYFIYSNIEKPNTAKIAKYRNFFFKILAL